MAIGLQKLSAGSGYEYLTRQVAALDATGRGRVPLADYYAAKGEAPGGWHGSGLAGLGLEPGAVVTAEQMKLLFGAGLHPVTGVKLGQRYALYANQPTAFETELAGRFAAWRGTHGLAATAAIPKLERDQMRTALAREWFTGQFGREPHGPRELYGFVARSTSRPKTSVAGYDLTFSPVKSVSSLWALADREIAARIREAHEAAVGDALRFIEQQVLFTRQGHNGVRQVNTRGLVAAVFTHRDSRTGDPDLHTHVAIANKVQTLDGAWLAIDGRVLYHAKVGASEVYTTSLQARLVQLGLRFVELDRDGRRPVSEIVGVDPPVMERWSSRRRQIDARTAELVGRFHADHERPPTPAEKIELESQATLQTRPAKHEPRSEAEQRHVWRAEAQAVLGVDGVGRMLHDVFSGTPSVAPIVDRVWLARTADAVVARVESGQASWLEWHVRAEALRQVRSAGVRLDDIDQTVDQVVKLALSPTHAIRIATTRDLPEEPDMLRRLDGTSVYQVAGSTRYTSCRVLWAERRLVDAAGRADGRVADPNSVTLALLQSLANGDTLNPGQRLLVHDMATSGRRLQLAIAPAGTGKTTAMRALATAWTTSGGTVVGLAPSAAAAEQLGLQLATGPQGQPAADTLAKLAWAIGHAEPLAEQVGPRTLVIIDEAGMADTLTLDHVVSWCLDRGASVRLIGDDQQLGAIGAGGVLRDIAAEHGAVRLDEVVRFASAAEAEASLALRAGDPGALGFYYDHDRVHVADASTAASQVFDAWLTDTRAGVDALMLAPTRALVTDLNAAARTERLGGRHPGTEVRLADGNHASVEDVVLTRRNNRAFVTGQTAWVKNGDRWRITKVHADGSLDVQNLRSRGHITLPADYVAASVELGYATTIHGAQGVTADTCHGLLTGTETRQQLYTMLTRGRTGNHAWLQVTGGDPHTAAIGRDTLVPPTATDLLEQIIARDDAPVSATSLVAQADDPARLLGPAVACYLDAIAFAAEHHLSADVKAAIDEAGRRHGLMDADAWPALRSHLVVFAANGHDPSQVLDRAVDAGGLETARDAAAVIDFRLDVTQASVRTRGPLTWLPGVPAQLLDTPDWKAYLSARFVLVRELGLETQRNQSTGVAAPWVEHLPDLEPGLVAKIGVWRAAHQIPDTDLRPTGPVQHHVAEARIQHALDREIEAAQEGARGWAARAAAVAPAMAEDPRLLLLGQRLAQLDQERGDVARLLSLAARQGDLPDDHPADALGYRITELVGCKPPTRSVRWETVESFTPTDPHQHEYFSSRPADHGRGIDR